MGWGSPWQSKGAGKHSAWLPPAVAGTGCGQCARGAAPCPGEQHITAFQGSETWGATLNRKKNSNRP